MAPRVALFKAAIPGLVALHHGIQQRLEQGGNPERRPATRSSPARIAASSASLLSREEGKTLAEGIGEVTMRAGQIFEFFAGEALRLAGESVPSVRPGVGVEITREPMGVVGIITPWNFPIAIPAWKIAPALCYGNTVVFKPADLVPAAPGRSSISSTAPACPRVCSTSSWAVARWSARRCSTARTSWPMTFTGSVGTGRAWPPASSVMRKFQLEMGGKNPMVVLDDADLKVAVECVAQSAFFSTGQRCTRPRASSSPRASTTRSSTALCERMKNLVVGDALEKDDRDRPGGRCRPAQAGHRLHRASARRKAPSWWPAASG
jgi:acyl-CoA reductase-like NAD-dependent aldehyde dehydrogenase